MESRSTISRVPRRVRLPMVVLALLGAVCATVGAACTQLSSRGCSFDDDCVAGETCRKNQCVDAVGADGGNPPDGGTPPDAGTPDGGTPEPGFIEPATSRVPPGFERAFRAWSPSGEGDEEVTARAVWSVSDESVATFQDDAPGVLLALVEGEVTITATLPEGSQLGTATVVVAAPALLEPVDMSEVPDAAPTLRATAGDGELSVVFEWSVDPLFEGGVFSTRVPTDAEGRAAWVPDPAPPEGVVVWWRGTAALDDGTTFGPPTEPRSLLVNTSLSRPRWRQTSQAQLEQGTFTDAQTQAALDGEVVSTAAAGGYTSAPVALEELGGGRWGSFAQWSYVPGSNASRVRARLERSLDGVSWEPLPEEALPGNDGGFANPITDLSGLDPQEAPRLRASFELTRAEGYASPELHEVLFTALEDDGADDVRNGGFEAPIGPEWTLLRAGLPTSMVTELQATDTPYEGQRYVHLENLATDRGNGRAALLSQVMSLPTDAATLSYAIRYVRTAYSSKIRVRLGGLELETIDCSGCPDDSGGWQLRTFDISSLRGQTVRFELELDGGNGYFSGNVDHPGEVDLDALELQ